MSTDIIDVAQNLTEPSLTAKQLRAASWLAEDNLTDEEIASKCHVSRRTIADWKLKPQFRAKMLELRREVELELLRQCRYASKIQRVLALADEVDKLDQVGKARAQDPRIMEEPGGETGRIAIQEKVMGVGKWAERLTTSEIDTGLIGTKAKLLQQIAQELGQWTEKRSLTFDLRKEAERLAAELGLTAEQVMNEAGLLEGGE